MSELWRLSASDVARLVKARNVSARGVADAALQRLDSVNPRINAIDPALGCRHWKVSTGLVGQSPVGVQIVASRYREDLCLRAGEAIEARGTPPAPIDPRN